MSKRGWRTAILAGVPALGLAPLLSYADPLPSPVINPPAVEVSSIPVCDYDVAPGHVRCHAHLVVDADGQPLTSVAPTISGYHPSDLRSAYNITDQGSSSTTIAIVDAFGYANAEADLAVYRSTFGLPACTTANGCFSKYNQRGGQDTYPADNVSWDQETALDLDMVSAMCPNCKIVLVQSDDDDDGHVAAAVNIAAGFGPHAISNSYGDTEAGSQGLESAYNHPGIAVTASSGDDGYGVSVPAAYPEVIAVGGTSLSRASGARGWSETAWSGAGSGCSTLYAKPSWQLDTGCANRTIADVSAVADPGTGVTVYGPASSTRTGFLVFGGTSVAAPLIAGIYGVNNRAVSAAQDLYQQTAYLNDVISGSNGSCSGTYLCTAGTGYDGPTGLGTPYGVTALGAPSSSPGPPAPPPPAPPPPAPPPPSPPATQTGPPVSCTDVHPCYIGEIPSLSWQALMVLAAAMAGCGALVLRRRKPATKRT